MTKHTVPDLRKIARDNRLQGYSQLRKKELYEMVKHYIKEDSPKEGNCGSKVSNVVEQDGKKVTITTTSESRDCDKKRLKKKLIDQSDKFFRNLLSYFGEKPKSNDKKKLIKQALKYIVKGDYSDVSNFL